ELKQIKADDQAIQTIVLGLPEDIYAAVDSCETAQEIWLRVKQMMKGSDIGIQEKKAKLFNEWERFTSTDGESIESYYHRFLKLMKDFKRNKHFPEKIANYTQLYDFQKYNQKEVNDLRAERLTKTQDPLALMATSNNPYTFPVHYQDQPSPNITDPTTAMNMAFTLMAKAFKLNYSTPTNNNQRISSNLHNRQIAQPENLNGYNAVQNVGNQVVQNVVQNLRVQNVGNQNGLIVVPRIANQNLNGNGNFVAARAEGNATGHNGNQIWCYNCRRLGHFARNCTVRPRRMDAVYLQTQLLIAQKEKARIQLQAEEFDLMAAAADLDEIEEVNTNCILMANLQQASTSGTQTDKGPVYDSYGSVEVHNYDNCYDNETFNMFTQEEEYTELPEPIHKPHQVPQNDNNVISEVSSLEESRGTVEQHPANVEEIHVLYDSLYNNLAIEVKKVNTVNRKLRETNAELTTELARYKNQEKCFQIKATKFVRDFKSLAKEADESLAKHKTLELEIERLLRAVVSQDIMSVVQNNSVGDTSNLQTELECMKEQFENCIIKKENEYAKLWNDWYKKCKECKYDKISYDKAYNDMQQKIERLQAQLGDLKGKSKDTLCVSNTLNPLSQKLENENVELEFQVSEQKDTTRGTSANTKFAKQSILRKPYSSSKTKLYAVTPIPKSTIFPKVGETHYLSKQVTSNSIPTPQESKVKKPPPRSNTKNDRVPSASKSSCSKNKEVKVEENPRNLLLSKNKKHMSSKCYPNLFMVRRLGLLQAYDWKSKASHQFCLEVLGTVRFRNDHVAVILGFSDLQSGNILITRVYFIEGLGHNLFLVGQFCYSDLEVAFRRNTCFVRNLEGVDLLKGNRTTNLYTINLHEMASASPIYLMARATFTKSWLWHQRLYHLNFNTIIDLAKNDLVTGLLKFKYHKEHLCPSCDSKPGLQSMTSGKISLGLDLTYAPSTITTQQPTEDELDFLFEAMYDDYIGGQPSAAPRTVLAAQAHQVCQTPTTSTSIADTAPTPTNSSSQTTKFPNTSQDVDGLKTQQQHVHQQGNQAPL
nr:retrovirus-related Pol polyprotein from transposon TNT 1-94 [Tanacetum cinerariifolium]